MYYLFCVLWLIGGAPKYQVNGQFAYADASGNYVHPSPEICSGSDCQSLKLNDAYEFRIKLKEGSYEIRYTNQWRQSVVQAIEVYSDLSLTVDARTFTPRDDYPVLAAFRDQGVLSVAERSEINGYYWERLMTFKSVKGIVEVQLYDPAGELNARKVLSPLEESQFEDFLRKVDLYHESDGCDTSVLFMMQSGEDTFIIEDSSCELQQLDTILYDLYVTQYVTQEFP